MMDFVAGAQIPERYVRFLKEELGIAVEDTRVPQWESPKLKDAAGLEKSGRFHTVVSGDTLSQLAAKHGLKDWQEIYNCFMNEFFRKVRQHETSLAGVW